MIRFACFPHYLHSQAQSERAAALNDIVPRLFVPIRWLLTGGGTLGRVVLPACQFCLPHPHSCYAAIPHIPSDNRQSYLERRRSSARAKREKIAK
jgi:hypothetical protein